MNILEYEMIEVLKELKKYGAFQIKAEYEAEGSRQVELMRLKDVADKAGYPLILKIGGVEALTDIYEALSLGARGIIAPMAETSYATSKFLNVIDKFIPEDNRKDIEFAINIETITAYMNLDSILELPNINLLNGITFGRVDFCGSLGADRKYIDNEEMFGFCQRVFKEAKKSKLKTALGGAISSNSIVFIKRLIAQKLLDKFETRKIVYSKNATAIDKGLLLGIKFELLWLKSKRRYYHRLKDEDEKRILMLEERLK